MGDTTTATLELFDRLLAPRPELCAALGCHDPLPDGCCRDCGKALTAADPVASCCPLDRLPDRPPHHRHHAQQGDTRTMIAERTLSRTARDAIAQLLANERADRLTHRSAMHAATRESLLARGLIAWWGTGVHLHLTDEGRAVAEAMER